MDSAHDMGGMQGFGAVNTPGSGATHDEPEEVRAQFVALLSKPPGGFMRGHIEALPPAVYLALPYYARWLAAAENMHIESGSLTRADLDRWYAQFEANPDAPVPRREDPALRARVEAALSKHRPLPAAASPRFRLGDAVVVKRMRPAGHHRCPRYVRGVRGTIERVGCEEDVPGDTLGAAGTTAIYTVAFASLDLWGPTDEPPFTVFVDLCETYLEEAP